MADISYKYDGNTPFGLKLFQAAQALHTAQVLFTDLKRKMDNITGGGVTTANLETDTRFAVATGQGAAAYSAVVSINAAINPSNAPIPASVDLYQG